jgi:two-component system cell cycle sensor histidine kinase PleC
MSFSTAKSADKNVVDRTKRTSPTTRLVKDLRQRVATNYRPPVAFEVELVTSVAENHRNAFIALPVFVGIVAFIAAPYIGILPASYWFVIAALAYGLLVVLSQRFLNESEQENVLPRWRRTFMLAHGMVAVAWGVFAVYGCMNCGDQSYLIIQFSTILVLQAITMVLCYGFGAAMLITAVPPTLLLSVRLLLEYDTSSMMMAGILIGSQTFFYLMADRFKLSVLSILEHKAEKESLIAELEMARSVSDEARRRAEEANLAKSRFLATMSHELRTPLNAILGFSEVMKGEVLGPIGNDSYREYVADIHSSGQHLLNVINEILDLSRIEAGRHELVEEAVRLVYVVDDAWQMVKMKAANKNINVVCQFQEDMPQIWADERAVRQITLNLLSNALKFTPAGGTIWIRVGWTSTGGQYIAVKDTGPGIPEEEIPVVLSSFGQGSIAIKSAEQGTGLGLPIVQALMHMHDGRF